MTNEVTAAAGALESPRPMYEVVDSTIEAVTGLVSTIDPDAMRFAFTLRTVSATVFHDLHERLAAAGGLTPRALNVLLMLTTRGDLDQGELTKLVGLSKATVSVLVEQLVKEGLVERGSRPGDRRVVILSVTAAGRAKFEHDFIAFNEGETAWSGALSSTERSTLVRLLNKLVANGPGDLVLP